ncbi:hypothetical protein IW967_09370 [Alicyclobacillus mali]|uniref:Uncharacterized protein n=1 Tax=Alicyclobacillus mali (ex Roth et al. 2021) TaxID=1123961 RepID=A0ABS0F481_9BACL|nr:hypothetical protein [Alicyclobacillus mali (ex Roth et al. 2021)]MBF8378074.1 hypothetical protein [Alicyclobacillus mali (ex Roth et al. 2021)]
MWQQQVGRPRTVALAREALGRQSAAGGRPENPAMARGKLWQDFVEESRIMTVEG